MATPILTHVPHFYAVGAVTIIILFGTLRILVWFAREALDLLRDLREFRRGRLSRSGAA
jgi:hypothetical protein